MAAIHGNNERPPLKSIAEEAEFYDGLLRQF